MADERSESGIACKPVKQHASQPARSDLFILQPLRRFAGIDVWRKRPLHSGRIRRPIRMGSHRRFVVPSDYVDIPIGRMGDDTDLRVADERVRRYATSRMAWWPNLRCSKRRGRFAQPMPYRGLGLFALAQRRDGIAITPAPRRSSRTASTCG